MSTGGAEPGRLHRHVHGCEGLLVQVQERDGEHVRPVRLGDPAPGEETTYLCAAGALASVSPPYLHTDTD
jgi:hypothetical protein